MLYLQCAYFVLESMEFGFVLLFGLTKIVLQLVDFVFSIGDDLLEQSDFLLLGVRLSLGLSL